MVSFPKSFYEYSIMREHEDNVRPIVLVHSMILSSRLRVRANSSLYVFQILETTRVSFKGSSDMTRRVKGTCHISSSMYCVCTLRISSSVGLSHCSTCMGCPTGFRE